MGLYYWVAAIEKYYNVLQVVKPKRQALQAAQDRLRGLEENLEFKRNQLRQMEEQVQRLFDDYQATS
jgi:ribosome recycling factor